MSPRRGERAAPPPIEGEYDLRFAFDAIRANPRSRSVPERHHRLKGSLGTAAWKGEALEQWQYEVTGGGRIWYVIDDVRRTAWIIHAGTGHPKATDLARVPWALRLCGGPTR